MGENLQRKERGKGGTWQLWIRKKYDEMREKEKREGEKYESLKRKMKKKKL